MSPSQGEDAYFEQYALSARKRIPSILAKHWLTERKVDLGLTTAFPQNCDASSHSLAVRLTDRLTRLGRSVGVFTRGQRHADL